LFWFYLPEAMSSTTVTSANKGIEKWLSINRENHHE